MEGNAIETYSRSVLDIQPGRDKSAVTFKNIFTAPLPYSGVAACPLNEHPKGRDGVRVLNSSPTNYTTWNIQTRSNLVAFGTRVHVAVEGTADQQMPARPEQIVILRGVALTDAINSRDDLTDTVIFDLRNDKRWMTSKGTILKRLPDKKSYRETKLNKRDLENVRSRSAPPAIPEAGPSRLSSAHSDYSVVGAEEAPPTGIPKKIPLRAVEPTLASIQGTEPIGVPKSQSYLYMEQYMTEKGTSSQGLPPGTRSAFSRDTPAIAYLISHMNGSNATFIDTAPILRAMLYAQPSTIDAWYSDKLDRHFIRQQVAGTRSNLTMRVLEVAAADRLPLQTLVVTLPAFASHLKGIDTLLGNPDPAISAGYNLSEMDISWVAVPIDAPTLHAPWLLEYIIAHLTSELWAGRTNWCWNARYHGAGPQQFRSYFTSIPNAHNVYIPGPHKLMLVLVEDTGYSVTPTIRIPGFNQPVNVYPGSRALRQPNDNLNAFTINLGATWYDNTFTTLNYGVSATRMTHAIRYMENNMSTNMAFAAAVTLTSEIANSMPEGLHIDVANHARNYNNVVLGGWTHGARNLSNRTPHMRTNDINTGAEEVRETNFMKMVAAYTFASLSPCLQYPASSTDVRSRDMMDGEVYIGKAVQWQHPTPTNIITQYVCHVSHSVYRVLRCLGYILKNEYQFNITTPAALQSVTVMNGVLLTLALTTAVVKNDVSLKVWTGLGADQQVAAHMSTSALVADWTNNFLRQRHPSHNFATTIIAADTTVDQALDYYYGVDSTENDWATHIPIPLHALMQWSVRSGVSLHSDFPVTYGRVSGDLFARYATYKFGNHYTLPLAAGSADVHRTAPVMYRLSMTEGAVSLPLALDEWSEMTSGVFDADVAIGKYQTNVVAISMRYHYQDNANEYQVAVINDMLCAKVNLAALFSVDPLLYPDPPNPEVFQTGQVASKGAPAPQNKEQEMATKHTLQTVELKGPVVQTTVQERAPVVVAATGPAQTVSSQVKIPSIGETVLETPSLNPAAHGAVKQQSKE